MDKPFGIILLLGSVLCFLQNAESTEDVCLWESFNASCPADEIVLIENAFYGRMHESRCIHLTENELNCSSDIRIETQKQYGLKDNIYFRPASEFFATKTPTCLKGRMPFLEISYKCIKRLVNEVCITETFKATCPPGTVIVIQSAHYGRMRSSRCLHFDDRELNCYADAQPYLESLCNGSVECSIRAGDDMLRDLYSDRCRGSLVPYLDVFYACVHDIRCANYIPPDDVTIEDIARGHRLSCISDRSISWEVYCVNETWVTDSPQSCSTSTSTVETSFVTEKDIQCMEYTPPENVTVEDIDNGHRLSCSNDRNISWEVHCFNNTWISKTSKGCATSKSEDLSSMGTVETPFVKEENEDGYMYLPLTKIIIIASFSTGTLIVFLITVSVLIHKRRRRNQQRVSSCYADIDKVQPMISSRHVQNIYPPPTPPRIPPKPAPINIPETAAMYEPLRTPIIERRRLPPDSSIYTQLLHEDEQETLSLSGATTINVPVNLHNVKLTLKITVDSETKV